MYNDLNEIKIGVSKRKAYLQISVAIGLFGITTWFLTDRVITLSSAFDRTFLIICCTLLMLTFGLIMITGFRTILYSETGVILNQKGIKINIGPNRGQFIKWDDINSFKIFNPESGPVFLLIFIKNPNELISKTFGLKRFLIKMNNASHGTPVSLTSNWLEYSFEDLYELINDYKNKVDQHHADSSL